MIGPVGEGLTAPNRGALNRLGCSEPLLGMPAAATLPGKGSTHVFRVAKELPRLVIPLAVAAAAYHWSLIRSEKHT
jgi:hypothetical protein